MNLFPNGIQGLADTKWSGVRGSAYRLVGVDYRSQPGLIQAHQALAKHSGTTIDELCKVALPLSDGSTLWFSSISGKIWREVSGTYTLLTTLTIPGYSFNLKYLDGQTEFASKDVSTQVNIPDAVCFKPDGLTMYILCNAKVSGNSGEIFQYTLTTAFDVSTASYASKTKVVDAQGKGMAFSSDGTKVYISEDNGGTSVITYTMSTAWDISTAGAAGTSFNFSAQGSRGWGLFFNSTGTKMVIFDAGTYEVNQYNLGTAWDVSTASFVATFDLPTFTSACISPDGTRMLVCLSTASGTITEYVLSTAWDVTTAVITDQTFVVGNDRYFGITYAPDNSSFYIADQGSPTEKVFQYKFKTAAADLNVTVLGAHEFAVPDGGVDQDEMTQYVYFATQNWLLRVALADITTLNTSYDYLTLFKYGDATYHPMKVANNRLFIGDKYTLCEVNEAGVITLESNFSVREPERITILNNFDVDLLIGTIRLDQKSRILRWDTESETWYGEDVIYESEIHAFLDDDNYTYALVGDFGQMYYYDGEKLILHTKIPGEYSPTKRCKINANAVGYLNGVPIFGLSNITGNPNLQGVYSYGRYSKDYNITLDLSYPLSINSFDGIEIGAIIVRGMDVYVSFKKGSDVGVDKLNWSAKYNGAYIETMVLNNAQDRSRFKAMDSVLADYVSIPSNTSLTMQYSKNYAAYSPLTAVVDAKLLQIRAKSTIREIGAVMLKFIFNTNANNSPQIENFHGVFEGER